MAKSSLNLDYKELHLHQQAKNSSHYIILNHETNELKTIPVDANLLTFSNNSIKEKFLDLLFRDQLTMKPSKEFINNLIMFYTYFLISSAILIFFASFMYTQNQLNSSTLAFHLTYLISLWFFAISILVLIVKKEYWLVNNQFLMSIFACFWYFYLIISNQGVISKLFDDSDPSPKLQFSLLMVGFIYFYRLVVFDSFIHILIPVSGTIILGIVLSMALSQSSRSDILSDYIQYTLILVLHLIDSQKISFRANQLFFRYYNEELKNHGPEDENFGSNFELVSNTELVVEKCDKVIKEIEYTRKTIIYKDIKDRLKSTTGTLKEIKKYLGRYARSETINFAENSSMPIEDKEFISQNFLNINKSSQNPRSRERHGTLRDYIERKLHFSFSHSMLQENLNVLDSIGQDWNLDMLDFNSKLGHSVSAIGKHLYHRWCIGDLLSITQEIAFRFFEHLEINYQHNPYHSAVHAADVFNSLYFFISSSDIEKVISPQESIACLIAALGHDVGHPGLTNRYLMESRHSLSVRYNDSSILENMHCAMIYTILNEPQCDIFMNVPKNAWTATRKLVIEMVLHTDMSRHFELLGRFRTRTVTMNDLNLENHDDRAFVLSIGLKCADLGHSAKEFSLHEKWTLLVCEEFFNQGDLEKKNNMPVSMYCDRDTTDIPKSQNGFLKNVCLPLYEVYAGFLRSESIFKACVEQIKENLVRWDDCSKTRTDDRTLQKTKEEFMVRVLSLKG